MPSRCCRRSPARRASGGLQRRAESDRDPSARLGENWRQRLASGTGGGVDAPAKTLAYLRFGEPCVGCAKRSQDWRRQRLHGQRNVGEATIPTGIFVAEPRKPGDYRDDGRGGKDRLEQRRPSDAYPRVDVAIDAVVGSVTVGTCAIPSPHGSRLASREGGRRAGTLGHERPRRLSKRLERTCDGTTASHRPLRLRLRASARTSWHCACRKKGARRNAAKQGQTRVGTWIG